MSKADRLLKGISDPNWNAALEMDLAEAELRVLAAYTYLPPPSRFQRVCSWFKRTFWPFQTGVYEAPPPRVYQSMESALERHYRLEAEWYRKVIAEEMGVDCPAGDAVCPLREWLREAQFARCLQQLENGKSYRVTRVHDEFTVEPL